jgi:Hint domain
VFSQSSLASNLAGDKGFDTATLAIYDPSNGSTTQPATPDGGYDPHDFVILGSTLYFEATDSITGSNAIYSFDGTTVTEIYNLNPTFSFTLNAGPQTVAAAGAVTGPLIAFNNTIYFGSGQESVEELASTGAFSNSATDVAGSAQSQYASDPASDLIVSNGYLFFVTAGDGVYSLDSGNNLTNLLPSIGAQSFTPVDYNGAVYFVAYAASGGILVPNLYSSTGGTPTLISSNFNGSTFAVLGSTLYYADGSGTDLGTINGTTLGTMSVPGGVGGVPLAVVSNATTSFQASSPIAVSAGASATFNSGGSPVTLDSGLTITDAAGTNLTSAAIVIGGANFVPGDTLNYTDQNGISGSYGPSVGELTLSGSASVADYQAALDSITYSFLPSGGDATNGGANPNRTITWAVGDGVNNSIAATSSLGTLCFCDGTLIATPCGEVEVEKLAAGDTVLTASGTVRKVTWAGAGRVLATRGRRGPATPVIVRKGALADNVPHTDMRVTKGHALLLDGVLIPVEFLVNHQSILWDDHAQEVSLRHIELETHDVLLANGAPAESYRDDGNRWLFQNANTGWDLPPQVPCAPVLTGGPVVDGMWRRLLGRSGRHKLPPLSDDPDLHLMVDGRRIDVSKREGQIHVFRVPKQAACVRIVSRDSVPAEFGLARDFRSLGVALRWIELSQGPKVTLVEADDARLADGFHLYESDGNLRWTNGDAQLPDELFSGFSRDFDVVLYVAATTRYPLVSARRAAA